MNVCNQAEIKMFPPEVTYSKLRWFWTIASLLLYIVDIVTDVGLALKYVRDRHLLWAGLTLFFVFVGLVATQIFSYAWYIDDNVLNPGGKTIKSGLGSVGLVSLHMLGMGIFTRYVQLLKVGHKELWSADPMEVKRAAHYRLFCLATDLSMLKLFEAFLESLPQLLLQVYLVLDHGECSLAQYVSMAFSFCNAAWALVDYRRCLRRTLHGVPEMPSGLPTVVYLLYKLFTITSRIMAFALLLSLSAYSAAALAALWLLGNLWAHLLRTDFCTGRKKEWVYRAVVGVVLTFTFFNVKGRDTRAPMSIYYLFHAALNAAALLLFATLWSPLPATATAVVTASLPTQATELWYFWPVAGVIATGTVVGLVCLAVYYARLHPRERRQEADEVDGPSPPEAGRRMRAFLKP
ncbi:unnamed protein product [Merluccius merluccius]